mmetsp:Transcript_26116/g.52944  ORF Transcript_26116/g.52944 Transcript_26116/m.52944 type:complete len:218 (-) Transcript_26116:1602-2255(-)
MPNFLGLNLSNLLINDYDQAPRGNGRNRLMLTMGHSATSSSQDATQQEFIADCKANRQEASDRLSKEQQARLIKKTEETLSTTKKIDSTTTNIESELKDVKELIKSSNPQQCAKLQASNVRLKKREIELEKKVAVMEKELDESRRVDSRKTKTGSQLKKGSTQTSSLQQPQEEHAEESHLGRQQAASNGTVKPAPAFGPGRRFKDGRLKKKSPFKLG